MSELQERVMSNLAHALVYVYVCSTMRNTNHLCGSSIADVTGMMYDVVPIPLGITGSGLAQFTP